MRCRGISERNGEAVSLLLYPQPEWYLSIHLSPKEIWGKQSLYGGILISLHPMSIWMPGRYFILSAFMGWMKEDKYKANRICI